MTSEGSYYFLNGHGLFLCWSVRPSMLILRGMKLKHVYMLLAVVLFNASLLMSYLLNLELGTLVLGHFSGFSAGVLVCLAAFEKWLETK